MIDRRPKGKRFPLPSLSFDSFCIHSTPADFKIRLIINFVLVFSFNRRAVRGRFVPRAQFKTRLIRIMILIEIARREVEASNAACLFLGKKRREAEATRRGNENVGEK